MSEVNADFKEYNKASFSLNSLDNYEHNGRVKLDIWIRANQPADFSQQVGIAMPTKTLSSAQQRRPTKLPETSSARPFLNFVANQVYMSLKIIQDYNIQRGA